MSQGDVRRKTGEAIAQSTIGRVLAKTQAPDLDTVCTISKALGYQPWQLLVPTFDPANPPFIPRLTNEEHALYDKFKALITTKK